MTATSCASRISAASSTIMTDGLMSAVNKIVSDKTLDKARPCNILLVPVQLKRTVPSCKRRLERV